MEDSKQKFVDFHEYCRTCAHKDKSESEDPCWDCLEDPVNWNSQKPTRWEEADEQKRTKKLDKKQS